MSKEPGEIICGGISMGQITGMEPVLEIPPKVLQLFEAVEQLIGEGVDVNSIRVSSITERAGIGKGTAYEYFDSKEEIIACSFLFYLNRLAEHINDVLMKLDSLQEQINYIFDELDKESEKKYCFVQFVHGATDNSKFSRLVREKLLASDMGREFPQYLFGTLIRQGVERGEINGEIPTAYLVYTVFCKVMTYMMFINVQDCFQAEVGGLRPLIIEGILRDVKGGG